MARHQLAAVELHPHAALPARLVHEARARGAAPRAELSGPAGAAAGSGPGGRLASLDAFRGLTIAAILLVNNPGTWSAIYAPLRHAEWHGWTPTDLIFPFFLFIVGVAMTLSFAAQRARGATDGQLLRRALRRAAILVALGLLLHGFPDYLDLSRLRIPGVLQRIGLVYAATSVIVLTAGVRAQAALAAALLLGYWALLTLVPVPGGAAGVLEPGRDLGAWLDRRVFTEPHLWASSRTWDPEGLLSTLPAIATTLTGVFTGYWLAGGRDRAETTVGLFLAGSAGLALGLAWDAVFPINKNLWTSSYVLFTSGFACHLLAICYWLIDVKGRTRWATPFVIFGVNAIAAFFLSSLTARILNLVSVPGEGGAVPLKAWLFRNLFAPLAPPQLASLAFAVAYVLFWLGVMAVLHRRRILIRV